MRLLSVLVVLISSAAAAVAADPPRKEPARISVVVEGDVGPALAPVAGKLTEVFFDSYPKLLERFEHPDKPAPRRVKIVFRNGIDVPAYCSGDTITVSVDWLTKHPDDVALMTHELTHAVQAYPKGEPGWVTEGIADYARFKYGPKEQPNWSLPAKLGAGQSYRDSYRTAARFFVWLDEKHPGVLDKVHRKMQDGTFAAGDWKAITGHDIDTLWGECVRDLQAK